MILVDDEKLGNFILRHFRSLLPVTEQEYQLGLIVYENVVPVAIVEHGPQNVRRLFHRRALALDELLLTLARLLR